MADIPQLKEAFAKGLRHPRHDGVGDVRRAGRGHAGATCAAAPRRSISASSTASRPSASPTSSRSRATRPAPTSRNTSSASPASATTWTAMRAEAKQHGYVRTLFGRKCHYPLNEARSPAERGFLERAAINAPIQGTAADIIRRAMIRMEDALARRAAVGEDAAAGPRRTGLRGAGRGGRGDHPGRPPHHGATRRCRPCSSTCRCRSTRAPPTTGTRRIEPRGGWPQAALLTALAPSATSATQSVNLSIFPCR